MSPTEVDVVLGAVVVGVLMGIVTLPPFMRRSYDRWVVVALGCLATYCLVEALWWRQMEDWVAKWVFGGGQ